MNRFIWLVSLVLTMLIGACTPKVAEKAPTTGNPTTTNTSPETAVNSKCPAWTTIKQRDLAIEYHVRYKDELRTYRNEKDSLKKIKHFDEAFELWKKVFALAPAADGKRPDHFEDGIRFYAEYARRAATPEAKNGFIKELLAMYDKRMECLGDVPSTIGRKGFELYYNYPEYASDDEKFALFRQTVDSMQNRSPYFVINPFLSLLNQQVQDKKVSTTQGRKYVKDIVESIEYGKANCKEKECAAWTRVADYTPQVMEQFELIEDFFDCAYYKGKYYADSIAAGNDCDAIDELFVRLRWGKCSPDDPDFKKVIEAKKSKCTVVSVAGPLGLGAKAEEDGKYSEAVNQYQQFIDQSKDNAMRAKIAYRIAIIQYVNLRNFSKSRAAARQALTFRPNWGAPYMLIGRLYASSGPLCGPGTGWASQIVTWPAIDMWQKAKSVDPSVSGEANKLINRYAKFMPDLEEIFQRGLAEGQSFTVGCWIQERTTIRAAK